MRTPTAEEAGHQEKVGNKPRGRGFTFTFTICSYSRSERAGSKGSTTPQQDRSMFNGIYVAPRTTVSHPASGGDRRRDELRNMSKVQIWNFDSYKMRLRQMEFGETVKRV